jgi:hypothetical protein
MIQDYISLKEVAKYKDKDAIAIVSKVHKKNIPEQRSIYRIIQENKKEAVQFFDDYYSKIKASCITTPYNDIDIAFLGLLQSSKDKLLNECLEKVSATYKDDKEMVSALKNLLEKVKKAYEQNRTSIEYMKCVSQISYLICTFTAAWKRSQ